jgi:lysophospholipase L1-like esterase
MSQIALVGDSMLARFTKPRIQRLEAEMAGHATVHNCAAGGWTSSDVLVRAPILSRIKWDAVVLSFGTNDCVQPETVSLHQFARNVAAIVSLFSQSRVIAFLPPVIRETIHPDVRRRTNRDLDAYRDLLRAAAGTNHCIEPSQVLSTRRVSPILEPDGIHLTDASYTALIPALAHLLDGARYMPLKREPHAAEPHEYLDRNLRQQQGN